MGEERKAPKVGEPVIYHDPAGRPLNALVTAVWSEMPNGCLNVVYVSGDENRSDSYGRQIERETSVNHMSYMSVHGRYWRFADEEPAPTGEPLSK